MLNAPLQQYLKTLKHNHVKEDEVTAFPSKLHKATTNSFGVNPALIIKSLFIHLKSTACVRLNGVLLYFGG